MKCIACEKKIGKLSNYCMYCGMKQGASCEICGAFLPEEALYCPMCGMRCRGDESYKSDGSGGNTPKVIWSRAVRPPAGKPMSEAQEKAREAKRAVETDIKDFIFVGRELVTLVNTNLKEVFVPDFVERIGCGAFEDCFSLEKVVIPKSVRYIDEYAFTDCKRLRKVILPEGLIHIGDYAFRDCTALRELRLPSTLESLGHQVFVGCLRLEHLDIPAGVMRGRSL